MAPASGGPDNREVKSLARDPARVDETYPHAAPSKWYYQVKNIKVTQPIRLPRTAQKANYAGSGGQRPRPAPLPVPNVGVLTGPRERPGAVLHPPSAHPTFTPPYCNFLRGA